jgi:uncharacterized RDD family membrane protein YckC
MSIARDAARGAEKITMAAVEYAGLGQRFLALAADFLVFCAVFFPVTRLVKGVWLMNSGDHLWGYGWLVTDPLCLIFLAVMVLYFVLLEGVPGATLGKRLMGIQVVQPDGGRPGVKRALIRNLLRAVDGLPALNILGVILIVTSPQRARFGDRVAGTRVVVRR